MNKKIVNNTKENFIYKWQTKGILQANNTIEYKEYTQKRNIYINSLINFIPFYKRKKAINIIDDINSLENARSSIEINKILSLLYNYLQKKD